MGIIGQFHLTFELAWKALREVLLIHGVSTAAIFSPREILKAGYQYHFIAAFTDLRNNLERRLIDCNETPLQPYNQRQNLQGDD